MKIVSFSGGKDSTAMLIILLENQISFDIVVFCDTGAEFPEIYDHIDVVEKKLGVEIIRILPEKPSSYWLAKYGWPRSYKRWCLRLLKLKPLKNYLSQEGISEASFYLGIASDEKHRMSKRNYSGNRYPLIDYKITEKEALKICYRYGFYWDGLYEKMNRTGCFWCPFQPFTELYKVFLYYPHLWRQIEELDRMCCNDFKPYYPLVSLKRNFILKTRQGKLFGNYL